MRRSIGVSAGRRPHDIDKPVGGRDKGLNPRSLLIVELAMLTWMLPIGR